MNNIAQHTKITHTDINTLISELNGKLNLSGGIITGIISSSNDIFLNGTTNNKRRHICSGVTYDKGAYICLDGCEVDDSQSNYYKGQFFIGAHNGTNTKILIGRPDGTLTWGGNEVATNNIVPSDIVNEVHPVTNRLCIIKASTDNAPNNGCILSYSISNPNWIGQLFIGDNANQGLYYRGASNGEWCAWKKVFIATEEGRLQFPNYTEMWIA